MNLRQPTELFLETLAGFFPKEHKKIRENIALCVYSILRGESVNTAEIARYMHEVNGHSFKTNDMRVYRLLQSANFQVSDRLWRGHVRLLFTQLASLGLKSGATIQVNVDYTTDRDDFLILCAAIQYRGVSLPVYFSLRNYPKRAGAIDQKKLELAFFKALRHLLPDSYRYVIVADRGFGHERILSVLENLKFDYVIRLTENFLVDYQEKRLLADQLPHRAMDIHADVVSWQRSVRLVKRVRDEDAWLLAASPTVLSPGNLYEKRFAIEKLFKNKKSGGFDLEKLLVTKYDRFKRMLFIACVAYGVFVTLGMHVHEHAHTLKKNSFFPFVVRAVFSG